MMTATPIFFIILLIISIFFLQKGFLKIFTFEKENFCSENWLHLFQFSGLMYLPEIGGNQPLPHVPTCSGSTGFVVAAAAKGLVY